MLFVSRCPLCSQPGPSPCAACARAFDGGPITLAVPGAATAMARYPYDGELRRALLALKYANARATAGFFAGELRGLLEGIGPAVVTWVPTSPARRRQRGFDQAELIGRRLARALGVPARGLLWRRPGPAQTGRSRAERREGPRFEALAGAAGSVVLVDDVATTLATAAAAVSALAQVSPAVHLRTVAATLARGTFGPCLS